MNTLNRREAIALLLAAPAVPYSLGDDAGEWITLLDDQPPHGSELGTRPFSVIASPRKQDFKNFELSADAMTRRGANTGICFHVDLKHPEACLEVRINNSDKADNRKTGSLVGLRNVYKSFLYDNEWFNLNIQVRDTGVQVRLNDMLVVDYTQSNPLFQSDPACDRTLSHGAFAIKNNGPAETRFRNIRVRPLPDNLSARQAPQPLDEIDREIIRLGHENFPVVDYHVHLKGGLTLEQALSNSRRLGIGYGIAINCGLNFPVHDDASVNDYLATMKGQPCYVALQGEGREWMTFTSPESIARFDYCFTDAMTFRDPSGFRRRLYVENEMGDLSDPLAFMEMYVARIEGVMKEPIDIYANPTFLPLPLRARYDALWTPARMKRVIDAAIENDVAIEINNRYRIPGPTFIKAARAEGAKFSFGTNNAEAELGRIEYAIEMVRECSLTWNDIFVPKPDGRKPIQVKKWHMTGE